MESTGVNNMNEWPMNSIVHADILGHFKWLLRHAVPLTTYQVLLVRELQLTFINILSIIYLKM